LATLKLTISNQLIIDNTYNACRNRISLKISLKSIKTILKWLKVGWKRSAPSSPGTYTSIQYHPYPKNLISCRVQGLLRGGAMKTEDKPIWYDVYAAFPPKLEPRFDRPAPEIPVRNIFYAEDVVRAYVTNKEPAFSISHNSTYLDRKLHKQNKPQETISLFDHRRSTQSQQFVQIYQDLKAQGALDEQRIYETALDLLAEQRQQSRLEASTEDSLPEQDAESKTQLLSDFKEAVESQQTKSPSSPAPPKAKKDAGVGINIGSLFKD